MIKLVYNKRVNFVILIMFMLTILGLIGTTYAFYSSSSSIQNMLITKGAEVFVHEFYYPDNLWLPGETKENSVWFGNQSEQDQVIRFKVMIAWFDNNGTVKDVADDTDWMYTGSYSPEPAAVNWSKEIIAAEPAWKKIGDYYYYNQVLAKKTEAGPTKTPAVIDSVTFSPAIGNRTYLDDDFSGKACRITIQMESLAVNSAHTAGAWKVTFTQKETALSWSSITP